MTLTLPTMSRRYLAAALVAALVAPNVPMFAAGRAAHAKAANQQTTGGVTGTAQSTTGQTLANYTVRIRDVSTNTLSGSTTSNAAGQFTFAGLNPGNYVVEIVNVATGQVVGASTALAVSGGSTVSVAVTASAVTAAIAGGGVAAAAGTAGSFFGPALGVISTVASGAALALATVAVTKANASPSK